MNDRRPTPLLRFEVTELHDADESSFDLRAAFGGRAIANARASLLDDRLFIEHLVVDERAQKQGVGTAVLKQLEREAGKRGLRLLQCTLWRGRRTIDVAEATTWLERRGFTLTPADGDLVHCVGTVGRSEDVAAE